MIGFASMLKFLRKQANMTAEEVADILGVKKRTIFAYEKDDVKPSYENLLKLADYFNVSLDFMVGRSKIYSEPEGQLPYVFKDENGLCIGKIDYVFGAFMSGNFPRQFLVVTESDGHFIRDAMDSDAAFKFLTLVYFLHQKIGIEYDAFQNNRVDLLTKLGDTYVEIAIDEAESAKPHMLAYDEQIIKDWIILSREKKIEILKEYYLIFK